MFKKKKKIAWFHYGENYNLNFFKMDVIIYYFIFLLIYLLCLFKHFMVTCV